MNFSWLDISPWVETTQALIRPQHQQILFINTENLAKCLTVKHDFTLTNMADDGQDYWLRHDCSYVFIILLFDFVSPKQVFWFLMYSTSNFYGLHIPSLIPHLSKIVKDKRYNHNLYLGLKMGPNSTQLSCSVRQPLCG